MKQSENYLRTEPLSWTEYLSCSPWAATIDDITDLIQDRAELRHYLTRRGSSSTTTMEQGHRLGLEPAGVHHDPVSEAVPHQLQTLAYKLARKQITTTQFMADVKQLLGDQHH
jgi:hypothetical protein